MFSQLRENIYHLETYLLPYVIGWPLPGSHMHYIVQRTYINKLESIAGK